MEVALKIIAGLLTIIGLLATLYFYLEQNYMVTMIFGIVTILFLIVVLFPIQTFRKGN